MLYEGRQIYFGRTGEAKEFFTKMGFECPERQTTADFLTSLTSPSERLVKPGFESTVPRTPDEFAAAWKNSKEYTELINEIEEYHSTYPLGGEALQKFVDARKAMQSKSQYVILSTRLLNKMLIFWKAYQVSLHHIHLGTG